MRSSHVMNELLETERAYVEELLCVLEVREVQSSLFHVYSPQQVLYMLFGDCTLCNNGCNIKLQGYAAEMDNPAMAHLIPSTLLSKKDVLFGNMSEIYQFHKRYTQFIFQVLLIFLLIFIVRHE